MILQKNVLFSGAKLLYFLNSIAHQVIQDYIKIKNKTLKALRQNNKFNKKLNFQKSTLNILSRFKVKIIKSA